ncbi:24438_t:CDS:1, partial [Gigaspora rosea]
MSAHCETETTKLNTARAKAVKWEQNYNDLNALATNLKDTIKTILIEVLNEKEIDPNIKNDLITA